MTIKSVSPFLYPHIRPTQPASSFVIDAAEEHIAFAGRFPKSGTLKAVSWSIVSVSSPDLTLRVSVETYGSTLSQPVATTDAAKTLYASGAVSANIVNPSAGLMRSAINGTSGISVTQGQSFCVVIRCISLTGGSITVRYNQFGSGDMMSYPYNPVNLETYGYINATDSSYTAPVVALEYDSELVPLPHTLLPNLTQVSNVWNSGSNPDRRAMMFRFPDYAVQLQGAWIYVDADSDIDVILYGPDGYTVAYGPHTITNTARPSNTYRSHYIPLNNASIDQNQWYRLALLPKSSTSINTYYFTYADIGSYSGMLATHEGINVKYSTRNGAPSSGDASWTDSDTQRLPIQLLVNGIDIPSGSGGGLITHPGMNGGCNA